MKKRLLKMLSLSFMLAVFAGFVGCNTENVDWEPAEISVNPKSIVFEAGEIGAPPATIDVEVASSRKWTVSDDMADWVRTGISIGSDGRTTVTVIAEINPTDKVRKTSITFMAGQRLTAVLTVEQKGEGGVAPGEEIYRENMGNTPLEAGSTNDVYPENFGPFDWLREGSLNQDGVEYSGASASIRYRAGTISKDYDGASGGNNIFFSGETNDFTINKINVTGHTNLIFTFGVSNNSGTVSPYLAPVLAGDLFLSGSLDGTNWTALTFTNDPTASWVLATSKLQVPMGTTELYIKFKDAKNSSGAVTADIGSKIRVDDFILTAGGSGGAVIGEVLTEPKATTGDATSITTATATLNGSYAAPAGVTATEVGFEYKTGAGAFVAVPAAGVTASFSVDLSGLTESTLYTYKAYVKTASGTAYGEEKTFTTTSGSGGGVIYTENMGNTPLGTTSASDVNPENFGTFAWLKGGSLTQAGVTYSGVTSSVRNRNGSVSKDYEGASGTNNIFFSGETNDFTINKINVTGNTNLILTFGISNNSGTVAPYMAPVLAGDLNLSGSVDGTTWTALTFTNAPTASWVLATSKLQVTAGTTELYIKFKDAKNSAGAGTTIGGKMRVDDFTLTAGGSGGTIIGGGTPAEPKAITGDATSITATTATLSGSYSVPAGVTATEVGIEYKTGAGAFVAAAAAAVAPSFSVNLSGLTEATTYTYKAYIKTASGTVYGAEKTFATTALVKTYITLAELRAKGETTVAEDVYVKGSVISGTNSGSKKNVIVSDGAAGIAIRFVADYEFAQEIGKEIEISLNGAVLAKYNGLLQINGLPNAQAVATGETKLIAATPITSTQLLSGNFESMYVAVSDVQVVSADLAKTVGDATTNTSIMIESLTDEFIMYTARYADFVADAVPTGSGVLKGVASVNLTTYQIYPQTRADYSAMTGARLPFPIAFGDAEFVGTLKTGDVASGNIVIPYTYAKGTESYNVTVVVGDVAAAGVTVADMTANITVPGSGNIEIPVTGTPTIEGGITFTVSGITGLAAADAVATATVLAAGAKAVYMNETFDVFDASTVEYPSAETAHIAAATGTAKPGSAVTDLPGWTGTAVFKAKGMVKMGAASGLGFIITPALSDIVGAQDVSLTFDAGAWKAATESTTMKVSLIGGGTFDDGVSTEIVVTGVPIDGSPMVGKSLTIKGATASTRIVFEGAVASKSRFFIDNVKVTQL